MKNEYKMAILIREDLPMTMGKFGVQINHATTMGLKKAPMKYKELWYQNSIKVVLLGTPSATELVELDYALESVKGLPKYLVTDLGTTEFGEPTITSLVIGPAPAKLMNKFTGKLNLYDPEFLKVDTTIEDPEPAENTSADSKAKIQFKIKK